MNKTAHRILLLLALACLWLPATVLAQPVFKSIDEDYEEDDDRFRLEAPGNLAVGDFMLVNIALDPDESVDSIPSGWTELMDERRDDVRLWVGYKFATQADIGDSFRWDFNDDVDVVGQLRVYSNVDPADPINDWAWDDDDTRDVNSPAVTTTRPSTMIVRMFGAEYDHRPDDLSPPHNNEYFEDACDCIEDGVITGSGDLPQMAAGNSGSASWDDLDEDDWISVTVALNPEFVPAIFHVTKEFSDGRDDEVEVTLRCNGGSPPERTVTITGGDPDGFNFVVEYLDGATCEITETGGADGFTPEYNEGEGCSWEGVNAGNAFECVIYNRADPVDFTVHKVWDVYIDDSSAAFDPGLYTITASCNAPITECSGGGNLSSANNTWFCEWLMVQPADADFIATVDIAGSEGVVNCGADEDISDSAVASENDCDGVLVDVGLTPECTITNTVFFEGIPALSRAGLALLALLMLGVGFIGYRRLL